MKIVLRVGECGSDETPSHVVNINGKDIHHIRSLSECSEDAIIGRDLIDGFDIINAIKMGYEAGKQGEPLEVSEVEDED